MRNKGTSISTSYAVRSVLYLDCNCRRASVNLEDDRNHIFFPPVKGWIIYTSHSDIQKQYSALFFNNWILPMMMEREINFAE